MNKQNPCPLTVITTVRNESRNIRPFLDAVFANDLQPDEVIIVDSLSSDDTPEIIKEYISRNLPVQLIEQSCFRATGRNIATRTAHHDVIVVVDVGVVVDKKCFRAIRDTMAQAPELTVAGGRILPAPRTPLEEAFGLLVPADPTSVMLEKNEWLPTSRLLIYRKSSFHRVNGYPENSSVSEDIQFSRALRKAGIRFSFIPEALGFWRPRGSWMSFFKQYYLYSWGEGVLGYFMPAYCLKILVYLSGCIFLLLGLYQIQFLVWLLVGFLVYITLAMLRSWQKKASFKAVLWAPVVEVINDLADITGYIKGLGDYFITHLRRSENVHE